MHEAAQKDLILYHGGACNLPNNRPVGNGAYHFGNKDFFRGLSGNFGNCVYVYLVPPEVTSRILDTWTDHPPTKFLNAALTMAVSKEFWGPKWKPKIPQTWDENSLDEYFAELVTNIATSGIVDVIRQFHLYGINNGGEYILTQDGINKLQFRKKFQVR